MRRVHVLVFYFAVFISLVAAIVAQDKPQAEVTGAYQFSRVTLSADGASGSLNLPAGFDASLNVPITRWFGAVGDIGRVWKTESALVGTLPVSATLSIWTYGGGPQLTYRSRHVQPFARVIIGEAHSSLFASLSGVSAGASVNSFFVAPGGGMDFRITHNVWLRGGAEYLRTSKDSVTVNGIRAFGGITFVLGGRGQSPRTNAPTPHGISAGMKVDALGVMVAVGRSGGAEITDEAPNGAAALSGLHVGDVINFVDDQPVKTPTELLQDLSNRPVGDRVRLGYLIHGTWQTEAVILLAQ